MLLLLAGAIYLTSFIPYYFGIVRKKVQPSVSSWIVWAMLDTTTAWAMWETRTVNPLILAAAITGWGVVPLSLIYAPCWKWTRLDTFCLTAVALSVVILVGQDAASISLAITLSVTAVGSVPTIVNAFNEPGREDRTAWSMQWISCVLTVAAVEWKVEALMQPLLFLVVESIMVFILWRNRNAA